MRIKGRRRRRRETTWNTRKKATIGKSAMTTSFRYAGRDAM